MTVASIAMGGVVIVLLLVAFAVARKFSRPIPETTGIRSPGRAPEWPTRTKRLSP
jgi:hypothetical protein